MTSSACDQSRIAARSPSTSSSSSPRRIAAAARVTLREHEVRRAARRLVVEGDARAGEQPVVLAHGTDEAVSRELRDPVGRARAHRRALVLRRLARVAEHLARASRPRPARSRCRRAPRRAASPSRWRWRRASRTGPPTRPARTSARRGDRARPAGPARPLARSESRSRRSPVTKASCDRTAARPGASRRVGLPHHPRDLVAVGDERLREIRAVLAVDAGDERAAPTSHTGSVRNDARNRGPVVTRSVCRTLDPCRCHPRARPGARPSPATARRACRCHGPRTCSARRSRSSTTTGAMDWMDAMVAAAPARLRLRRRGAHGDGRQRGPRAARRGPRRLARRCPTASRSCGRCARSATGSRDRVYGPTLMARYCERAATTGHADVPLRRPQPGRARAARR